MTNLNGRTALITGSSRGIGEYMARHLASAGANVAIAARTTEATRGYYDPSIQRASVFVQEIYDSLANDPNTGEPVRRPSKREIQQAVREVVAEEVAEAPVEETPTEEAPAEEAPVEETPAEEASDTSSEEKPEK